jgi:hypothetical protein
MEATIDEVESLVNAGVLNQGQGNALIEKLEQAERRLNKENKKTACNVLQAFVNQVEAFIKTGRLPEKEGQWLIETAKSVISQLCG